MRVCLLVFWSIWAPPFEGGQYVTCKRCERAGPIQAVHLSRLYGGPLHWKCKDMML